MNKTKRILSSFIFQDTHTDDRYYLYRYQYQEIEFYFLTNDKTEGVQTRRDMYCYFISYHNIFYILWVVFLWEGQETLFYHDKTLSFKAYAARVGTGSWTVRCTPYQSLKSHGTPPQPLLAGATDAEGFFRELWRLFKIPY